MSASISGGATLEYEVKAAFVQKFLQFIDWPEETFEDALQPYKIALFGRGELVQALLSEAKTTVRGRPVLIERVGNLQALSHYQVVVVAPSERFRFKEVIDSVRGSPVLTIGDGSGFCEQGGVINFYLSQNRVRFEINNEAAQQTNLRISSKLLKLARIVSTQK